MQQLSQSASGSGSRGGGGKTERTGQPCVSLCGGVVHRVMRWRGGHALCKSVCGGLRLVRGEVLRLLCWLLSECAPREAFPREEEESFR
jgi:hypothetical protein